MENSLSKIAENMRKNKDKILQIWEQRVRKCIPEAKNQNKAAIYNTLSALFDRMADTLAKNPPKVTAELENELEIAREHGEQRSRFRDYSLEQIIYEYQLLRQVTIEILEEEKPLIIVDRNVILDAISLSERRAAMEFYKIKLALEKEISETKMDRDSIKVQRDLSLKEVNELHNQRELREFFVTTLSHDLLNPISAAIMNLQFLIRKKDELGALELYSGRILDILNQISLMIIDLLDANKIHSGQHIPLKITEVDLNNLIKQNLETLISIHGDRFILEAKEQFKGFWDVNGIRRMIENLCINALKYGYGDHRITVTIKNHQENQVEIKVHNDGNPIPERDQKKIFLPFQRLVTNQSSNQKGWGIGLTLVKGIAESHGGGILVESSVKSGTTFSITLPVDSRGSQECSS